MPATEEIYADKIARARRRHGKPFRAHIHVTRTTPPTLLLKSLLEVAGKKKPTVKSPTAPAATEAATTSIRRIGGKSS